ncbi:MAG TPA: hypothetical protein VFS49_06945 [Croceibacterium sp.]|nr:hypothetical protein [Croceibacterium sp.]
MAATLAAGAVVFASLPTAGFALGALNGAPGFAQGSFMGITPASADPRLAAFVAERSNGKARLMRFTPAGAGERSSRSVTVAVRVDENSAQAISVRSAIEGAMDKVAGESGVRIAPTRYSLGVSRGYQNFARPTAPVVSRTLSDASIPDLSEFRPSPGAKEEPSRFAARIDSNAPAKPAEATPRITPDQTVDLEGSYRLTRNLDVTAGVRYSQDRDRLAPLAEPTKQDSQAVYVGTQFRF